MSKCVHLLTNPEVKHVGEGFHREFLGAACVEKSRFIFSNRVSIRVRWLVGLWQLPEEGESFYVELEYLNYWFYQITSEDSALLSQERWEPFAGRPPIAWEETI